MAERAAGQAYDAGRGLADAGLHQLQETDIGTISLVIRLGNFMSAMALILLAGLLTIYRAIFKLWLCDVELEGDVLQYALPEDFWTGCGTTKDLDVCKSEFKDLSCMDIYLDDCVDEEKFWAGGGGGGNSVCTDTDYTNCLQVRPFKTR